MGKNVYQIVADRILERIQEAIQAGDLLPWQKPWTFADVPKNYVSQKCYRGVNTLLLDPGDYLTWNQLCDLEKKEPSLRLRKGSKSHIVVYFKFLERVNVDTQDVERIPMLRYYKVFNVRDIDGLEAREPTYFEHEPIVEAEQLITSYVQREGITLQFELGDKACYSPVADRITLPERKQFKSQEEFYGTAFHEMAHSTGHAKRLDRGLLNTFADSKYSQEELVAEMASAMLLAQCGLLAPTAEKNSAAYVKSWMEAIKGNPRMIVTASSKAQKAADYILGVPMSEAADSAC